MDENTLLDFIFGGQSKEEEQEVCRRLRSDQELCRRHQLLVSVLCLPLMARDQIRQALDPPPDLALKTIAYVKESLAAMQNQNPLDVSALENADTISAALVDTVISNNPQNVPPLEWDVVQESDSIELAHLEMDMRRSDDRG